MPPSPLVSISLLATGALAGAGVASLFRRDDERKHLAEPAAVAAVQKPQPAAAPTHALTPTSTQMTETDLLDRRLLAQAARQAGGAVEASGYPGPISDLLVNTAYLAGYDRRLRHPSWVACHMTAESLLKVPRADGQRPPQRADRSNSTFREDERIPEPFRAKLADYFRSGYDRGHMVAAADAKFSQAAMDETFFLTNIAPQVGEGFNRDYWAHTEDFCRRLTAQFADVYVFTVPLYLPKKDPLDGKWRVSYEVIGSPPSVSVPTHFAKVVLGVGRPSPTVRASASLPSTAHGGPTSAAENPPPAPALTPRGLAGNLVGEKWVGLGAFVIPNAPVSNSTPLRSFAVPVDAVERAAGLALFPAPVKATAKELCSLVDCSIVVREFNDASRKGGLQRSSSAPAGLAAPPRS